LVGTAHRSIDDHGVDRTSARAFEVRSVAIRASYQDVGGSRWNRALDRGVSPVRPRWPAEVEVLAPPPGS
jgi:hypothetical protein